MIAYPLIKLTDTLGGISQQLPAEGRTFEPGEIEQERTGRVSSGTLATDVLTSKSKYTITYELLDAPILANLVLLRKSNNDLEMQYQETYTSEVETKTVRIVAPIERIRFLAIGDGVYSDVKIEIEEV